MLSIIAVAINNLEVNRRFVSSIRQHTRDRYELILIDNGSTQKAAADFLKRSADKYFRFKKIVSLAQAWNKGIKLSHGEYIAVINNDVVVPPNWFNPLKQTLDKNRKAGMVHPLTLWLLKQNFGNTLVNKLDKNFSRPYKLRRFKEIVWGEFMVFKRKALKATGGFDERYKRASCEDLEMVFRLFAKGYDIYLDPRVFVYHEGGASQTPDIISKTTRKKYWNRNWKLFLSRWPKYTKGWK